MCGKPFHYLAFRVFVVLSYADPGIWVDQYIGLFLYWSSIWDIDALLL